MRARVEPGCLSDLLRDLVDGTATRCPVSRSVVAYWKALDELTLAAWGRWEDSEIEGPD
jgi:hypothetical protein